MAFLHRALFTWFVFLGFLILLVLKLDGRIQWNWFVIFIPLWFYEGTLFICTIFSLMSLFKTGLNRSSNRVQRQWLSLAIIVLKIASKMTCCLKLENATLNISMFYVMAPFWIILSLLIVDVFLSLTHHHHDCCL